MGTITVFAPSFLNRSFISSQGSGLPAGPGGLLGAAEGLSFLAALAGLLALALQLFNFGYIPNAIPMDGGMCS